MNINNLIIKFKIDNPNLGGVAFNTDFINTYKVLKGCEICGYNTHALALEFDHLDREKKSGNVSSMTKLKFKTVLTEIKKCRVLCSNCHRIVTWIPDFFEDKGEII